MSSHIPPAGTGAAAQGSSTALGRGQGRGAGNAAANDLFALLMLQLGSDAAPATLTAAAQAAAGDAPVGAQDLPPGLTPDEAPNPLADLLAWTGTPATPATQPGAAAANASPLTPAEAGALPAAALSAGLPGPVGAREADTGAQAIPLPPGLQRLDTPAPADARLLATVNAAQPGANAPAEALPAGTSSDSTRTDTAQGPATTTALRHNPRAAQWRSTAGLGQPSAPAGAAYRAEVLRHTPDTGAGSSLAGVRSTVQLDERFAQDAGAGDAPAGSLAAALQGTQRGPGADRDAFTPPAEGAVGAAGSASEADGGGQPPQHDNAGTDTPPGDTAHEAREADTPGWSAQQLRQASLRVNAGEDSSIDIQLSLKGQEVQVSFRSDDAQTRASLAQDSALLDAQLQRSGMTLGGVSVGAQTSDGQAPGQGSGQPSPQATPGADLRSARRGEAAARVATPLATPQPAPRADGSRPLDLFV